MSYDLTRFGPPQARACEDALRRAIADAPTLEAAARALCDLFYAELGGPGGERACVMARGYATLPYGALPDDLQRFAKRALGSVAFTPPEPDMKCLVLLATRGDEPDWNDRRRSRGHQAIPLPSPHIVERAPMIAQLLRELGLDPAQVVRPATDLVHPLGGQRDGVFHVEQAGGSPYIPAQADFVARYGIRSVLGFGGAPASGDLFAMILFSRVLITADTAERFRGLAAALGESVHEHRGPVFDG